MRPDHTGIDSLGMVAATFGLPEQVAAALTLVAQPVEGLPAREAVTGVLVLGMGGSGIAGDVAAAVAGPVSPVPVVVSKDYELPAYVGPSTLVVAMSFSGGTEETLTATALALQAGAAVVAVCAGGALAELAGSAGAPVLGLVPGIPMPRAGIGALCVPVLAVLEDLGLVPGARAGVAAAVEQLARRRDQLARPGNAAELLARRIGRTWPLVYGGGALGTVAAARWKAQLNENTKIPSFANRLPEACHNEVAGWGQHGDVTRQVLTLVELRHDHEHRQIERRFRLVNELCAEVVAGVEEVRAEGDGPLAQLLDLVLVGDVVSLELALAEGLDPGPIPALDFVKAGLSG